MGRPRVESAKEPSLESGPVVVACDLFAGAGGFSLGAYLAGIRVTAAIELNRHACHTYRSNLVDTGLTDTKLFEEDIRQLSPRVFKRESGLDRLDCDILLGGPPCQGFSTHRLNDSGVIDPRNALLLRYFEYVRVIRPKLFLVENVPGMLWARHKSYVERFYSLARDAMYDVHAPIVLNARDFGVPQNRRRVFILGRDQLGGPRPTLWPPPATHRAPKIERKVASVAVGVRGLQTSHTAERSERRAYEPL